MKVFTIKTKRDGQGWRNTGEIYAANWQEAKQLFTDNIRDWCAKDDGVLYFDDEMIKEHENDNIHYTGPGYYNADHGWMQPEAILDGQTIDTFSEDVFTYTIKRV